MSKLLRHPLVLGVLAGVAYLGATALALRLQWAHLGEPLAVAPVKAASKTPPITLGARPWDFWSAETEEMIAGLGRERTRLDERAHDLETLQTRLDGEKAELDRLREQITQARQDLDRSATDLGDEETRNLRPLAQTYAHLSARAAVAVFRELDDATALKILALMKSDGVTVIFEEMAHTANGSGTLATRVATLTEKLRLLKKTTSSASASPPAPGA